MPSFDIVSEVDMQEVRNAVDQANREVGTRFDFKDSQSHFEQKEATVTLIAQTEFQLKQMMDILQSKLIKRNINIACLDIGKTTSTLKEARQPVTIKQGIDIELAKDIVKLIKGSKLKVQSAIQGEQVRVTGKKRDDLQDAIAVLREQKQFTLPLQFTNFRD